MAYHRYDGLDIVAYHLRYFGLKPQCKASGLQVVNAVQVSPLVEQFLLPFGSPVA